MLPLLNATDSDQQKKESSHGIAGVRKWNDQEGERKMPTQTQKYAQHSPSSLLDLSLLFEQCNWITSTLKYDLLTPTTQNLHRIESFLFKETRVFQFMQYLLVFLRSGYGKIICNKPFYILPLVKSLLGYTNAYTDGDICDTYTYADKKMFRIKHSLLIFRALLFPSPRPLYSHSSLHREGVQLSNSILTMLNTIYAAYSLLFVTSTPTHRHPMSLSSFDDASSTQLITRLHDKAVMEACLSQSQSTMIPGGPMPKDFQTEFQLFDAIQRHPSLQKWRLSMHIPITSLDDYQFIHNRGTHGVVFVAFGYSSSSSSSSSSNSSSSYSAFAIKVQDNAYALHSLEREHFMLSLYDSPYIVKSLFFHPSIQNEQTHRSCSILLMPFYRGTLSEWSQLFRNHIQKQHKKQSHKTKNESPSCSLPFSTCIHLIQSMLHCLQACHNKDVIHGDIRQDNFLIEFSSTHRPHSDSSWVIDQYKHLFSNLSEDDAYNPWFATPRLILSDFGTSKYLDPTIPQNIHRERPFLLNGTYMTGSYKINMFDPEQQKTRKPLTYSDDLESALWVLWEVWCGQLPWYSLLKDEEGFPRTPDVIQTLQVQNQILDMKLNPSSCSLIPPILHQMLQHARSLHFDQKPDYAILFQMCSDADTDE